MYGILADIVVAIHFVVVVFMVAGVLLPKKWRKTKIKIFHSYFCVMVLIFQVIYGFHCPLVVLEEYLRQLDNPNYVRTMTPFTERLFMKLFGISISSNVILCIIVLFAIIGIAQLLTMRKTKKGEN